MHTDFLFEQLSRPLAGASEELDSENLLHGFIGTVCKHDTSIHMPVTQDHEQQVSLAVYHLPYNVNLNRLCQFDSTNSRIPHTGMSVNFKH